MDYFERILEIVASYESLGVRSLADGTKLTGHVPHVAPQAWFQQVYPALDQFEIERLEESVGIKFPQVFVDFLKRANGLYLFSGHLYICGVRKNFSRSIEAAWQPFSIFTPNIDERPRGAKPAFLFVGGYESDGSQLYIDTSDLSVCRCSARSAKPLHKWASFEMMLESEVRRLATHFDSQGRLLDPKRPTTP